MVLNSTNPNTESEPVMEAFWGVLNSLANRIVLIYDYSPGSFQTLVDHCCIIFDRYLKRKFSSNLVHQVIEFWNIIGDLLQDDEEIATKLSPIVRDNSSRFLEFLIEIIHGRRI